MFDVILDDKNSTVIIVLTFQDYVEEKDRPANIKRDNRYKHQYLDKSKRKLL